jgi:Domain of unknown function (DUF4258)
MIDNIKECFINGSVYYSGHAKNEMELEELGVIYENEVYEAVLMGNIIEYYPTDEPYPSCLIFGRTSQDRPLHIVCAHSTDEGLVVVVTVYQPDPELWVDFSRRRI